MSSDWYARRLQGNTPPARGITIGPQPAPAPAPVQHAPVQQQVPQGAVQEPAPASLSDFLRGNASKGAQAAQTDGGRTCPNCGSHNLFSQVGQAVMKSDGTQVAPAPKCFECGWNGRFSQADQGNWASA